MKSCFFYIFIFLLVPFTPLFASFSEIEVYKTPLNQPIFFLGDAHDFKEERDGHYFNTLLKIFEEADNDPSADPETAEYVVFVENSPSVNVKDTTTVFERSRYILKSLCETATEKRYKRTKVIDCDPRNVSRALCFLFGGGDSIYPYFRKNQARQEAFKQIYKCGYFSATFQDVADSIDALKNQMLNYRALWADPKILAMFDEILGGRHKECLLRVFEEYGIDTNQAIFAYLCNIPRYDLRRTQLTNKVINIFAPFVDLFVLHHLLLEKNNAKIKKFIVIAGTAHTWGINMALQNLKIGYEHVYCESPSDYPRIFFKENGLYILQLPLTAIKAINPQSKWNDGAHILAAIVIVSGLVYFYY